MLGLKWKKAGMISVLLLSGALVTVVYGAERIYTNKNLEELQTYVESDNLNVQAVDNELVLLESQYNDAVKQKKEHLKQAALLQNQIDQLSFTKTQYTEKRNQKQLVEKHQLQVEYYNVGILIKQRSLAQSELEVMNKQVAVTEQKLALGEATQLDVDDIKNKKQQTDDKLHGIDQSIEQGKSALKARLNETADVQFDPNFAIPGTVEDTNSYTLADLKKNCADHNLQLLQTNAYINLQNVLLAALQASIGDGDASYTAAIAQRAQLQLGAEQLEQQIGQFAEKQYRNWVDADHEYDTMMARKAILQQQLAALEQRYSGGVISEVSYLTSRYSVLEDQLRVDTAIVNKLNAMSLLNLVNKGIIQS